MRDIGSRQKWKLGADTFYIQMLPPFEAMRTLAVVQKVLLPGLGGMISGVNKSTLDTDVKEGIFPMLVRALMEMSATLSEKEMDQIREKLLNPEYVAVQMKGDSSPQKLTEPVIDEIFTGRPIDLILLMVHIFQVNYLDFSRLSGLPSGFIAAAGELKRSLTGVSGRISR